MHNDEIKKVLRGLASDISVGVSEYSQKYYTSIPHLDIFLGGGIPYNTMFYMWGITGTGKTTLAMQILYSLYKQIEDGIFIVFDTEEGINSDWFKRIRLTFDYIRLKPYYIEDIPQILTKIREKFSKGKLTVLWDSVSSTPVKNVTGRGDVARAVSSVLRDIQIGSLDMNFIIINQFREKTDIFSPPEPPSGNYLRHASSITLYLASYSKSKFFTTRGELGRSVLFKIQKNRSGFTDIETRFELNNFSGYDPIFPALLILKEYKLVDNVKGTYKFRFDEEITEDVSFISGNYSIKVNPSDYINVDKFSNLTFSKVKDLYDFMLMDDSKDIWMLSFVLFCLNVYSKLFFNYETYKEYTDKICNNVFNFYFGDGNFVNKVSNLIY